LDRSSSLILPCSIFPCKRRDVSVSFARHAFFLLRGGLTYDPPFLRGLSSDSAFVCTTWTGVFALPSTGPRITIQFLVLAGALGRLYISNQARGEHRGFAPRNVTVRVADVQPNPQPPILPDSRTSGLFDGLRQQLPGVMLLAAFCAFVLAIFGVALHVLTQHISWIILIPNL